MGMKSVRIISNDPRCYYQTGACLEQIDANFQAHENEIAELKKRITALADHIVDADGKVFTQPDLDQAVLSACEGLYSQAELDKAVAEERKKNNGRIVTAWHRGDRLYTQAEVDAAVANARANWGLDHVQAPATIGVLNTMPVQQQINAAVDQAREDAVAWTREVFNLSSYYPGSSAFTLIQHILAGDKPPEQGGKE